MGMLAKLLPGFAFKVNDRLSVGGTFGMGFSQVNLEGPLFVQTGFLQGTPTLIDLESDGITSVWTLGLQYQLNDRTTLGASYQSQSEFDLDGTATVQIPLAGSSRYDATLGITWPQSLGGGFRHELDDRNTISMDVIWYDWSGALDQLDLRLQNPTNPFFIPLKDQLPLDWKDSVSIRAGYEHKLDHNRTLRLGYVYHRNPIPDSTLTPFLQAILQHTISVGYGWEWKNVELDLGYRFLFGETEDVGTSALVGGDFDGSSHRAYAHSLAFGIRWGK
jgi:long-subunit fatty acid transport protein